MINQLHLRYGAALILSLECAIKPSKTPTAVQEINKEEIKQRPAVIFLSEATYYNSTKNDKGKYIKMTWRHTPTIQDTKKNNYIICVIIFDHGTPKDMTIW